jgi:SPP1 family predicted phage head-tail adaptor
MADCGGCDDIASQHRFTLESPAGTPGPSGHVDLSVASNWATVSDRLWGKFLSNSGKEGQGLQQVEGQRNHKIEFAYQSSLINVTSKSRLRLGTRIFNIASIVDVNEARQLIHVDCTEPV